MSGHLYSAVVFPVTATNDSRTTFIEAELARLRSGDPLTGPSDDHYDNPTSASLPRPVGVHPQRQPAVVGKLQEVDLGPSAALKNIALTEAATRRLHGTPSEERKPPEKILLGRDGKPRRRRYRRPSDALKRDAIVEEIMRESKREWRGCWGLNTERKLTCFMPSGRLRTPEREPAGQCRCQ